jgi:hypothetical protein
MVEVWAVVGDADTGKSSTIRALTGVSRNQVHWGVCFLIGGEGEMIDTLVHPGGLQEAGKMPEEFIDEVIAAGVDRIIVALRYNKKRWKSKNCPNAAAYFTAFNQSGWRIRGYAVLGGRPTLPQFPEGIPFEASTLSHPASNLIAATLRPLWNIV